MSVCLPIREKRQRPSGGTVRVGSTVHYRVHEPRRDGRDEPERHSPFDVVRDRCPLNFFIKVSRPSVSRIRQVSCVHLAPELRVEHRGRAPELAALRGDEGEREVRRSQRGHVVDALEHGEDGHR